MTHDPPKFHVLSGPLEGREITLTRPRHRIGRTAECEIVFDTPSVSRVHAEILETAEGLLIRDLESKNGITVNGQAIQEAILTTGDEVVLGSVRLKFTAPAGAALVIRPPDAVPAPPAAPGAPSSSPSPQMLPVPSRTPSAGFTGGRWLTVVFILAGVLAAAVLAISFRKPPIPPETIALKAGEEKLLNLRDYRIIFLRLKTPNPEILTVRIDGKANWILYLKTLQIGETTVDFLDTEGRIRQQIKVIVKGYVKPPSSEFSGPAIALSERLRQAEEAVLAGEALERDRALEAIRRYQQALDILEKIPQKPKLYFDAKIKLDGAQRRLQTELDAMWERFERHRLNKDYAQARLELENILKFVPDPAHLDNQRARIYRQVLDKRQKPVTNQNRAISN
ncbi:MAG: FHA domain-containing protein [Planctomycetota bacterium]